MQTLQIEYLFKEEMAQVKGGRWVVIEGEWYWVEDIRLNEKTLTGREKA